MTLSKGRQGGILGFGEETTFGTGVAAATFVKYASEGVKRTQELQEGSGPNGDWVDDDDVVAGKVDAAGPISLYLRYEKFEKLFKHALGLGSTVETATFIITGSSNDKIDLKEDAGGELTATLTAGTYKMGDRGHYEIDATNNKINFKEDAGSELTATLASAEYATAALLAAQIKTQMESAGAGTYTLAYSATTNKFTVTVSGAVSTFQFLWKTGTNGADGTDTAPHDELGFLDTLDGIDAASDASDYSVYDPDGTLCAEMKTQLESAGSGTYTVTFSNTTKVMTVAVATGASAVQFLPATGTNKATSAGSTIGFAADSSSAASITADTAVVTVFDHTMTNASSLPTGMTYRLDTDRKEKVIEGGKINTLSMSSEPGGFAMLNLDIVGEDLTFAAVSSPTITAGKLVTFSHGAVTYNEGSIDVSPISWQVNNGLNTDRYKHGAVTRKEAVKGSKTEVTGSFTLDYEDETQFDDMVAATSRILTYIYTGSAAKSGFYYTYTITFPKIKLLEATPVVADENVIPNECSFKAYGTDSSTREVSVVIRNTLSRI